jgi:hypothetical protein
VEASLVAKSTAKPPAIKKTNTYQKNNLKVFVKRIKYYLEVYLHKKGH